MRRSITRRHADADRGDVGAEQLLDGLLERREQRLLRLRRRRTLAALAHGSVAVDQARGDLRPAEVDADHAGIRHGARLPYRPACRPRTSPTASTAADARRARSRRCRRPSAPRAATAAGRATRAPLGARAAGAHAGASRWGRRIGLIVLAARPPARRLGRRRASSPSAAASRRRTPGWSRRIAPRSPQDEGSLLVEPDGRPPARHRPLAHDRGPAGRAPLGLDDARAHRPAPRPHLVPLDPARPPGRGPGRRHVEDQRRVAGRRRRARDPHDPRSSPGSRSTTSRSSTSATSRSSSTRSAGSRSTCRAPIVSNKFDCPLRDAGAVRAVARLALRQGRAGHGRPARARSTRASARTSSTRRETDITRGERQQAGDAGDRAQARRAR